MALALLEVARAGEVNGSDRGALKERLSVSTACRPPRAVGELFWPVHAAEQEPGLDARGTWATWATTAFGRRAELLQALGSAGPPGDHP